MSSQEQILSNTICRNLSDRSYEKRKTGALAIEQLIRQLNQAAILEEEDKSTKESSKSKLKHSSNNATAQITKTINFLVNTFIRSTQANHRKGGTVIQFYLICKKNNNIQTKT